MPDAQPNGASGPRKPVTAPSLAQKKAKGERIVVVTAYDHPSAHYADAAEVDVILVGDSASMVVLGYPNPVPITMEEMLHHVRAVSRAQPKALIVADLPFLSYQVNPDEAVFNAGRMLKEGGAQAVKLEGGAAMVPTVERIVSAGIPVMAHLGLTPQSIHRLGGWKVQARKADAARQLLDDALALESAGAFAVVLESIPAEVAQAVSAALTIPTIGIGAGPGCDGQVQVFHDLLGLFDWFVPKHTRRYADLGPQIRDALARYAEDVRSGAFPAEENTFHEAELQDAEKWKP
jgi:3-methyl-2-oxobutanoate hydroxymethyltransferase